MWGTSLGRGKFRFVPGKWHRLQQQVVLNTIGATDGVVRVWLDGVKVLEAGGLRFRDVPELKIDGIYFTTFFGGNDLSWATPKDTYIEFADFVLSEKLPE
jgi:hypothetical protein